MIQFTGAAKPCDRDDVIATAFHLELPLAVFQAVLEVETDSSGFDQAGRPTARFERHIFHAQLTDQPELRARAVAEGLAYPQWGMAPPATTSDQTYDEIERACQIDQEAALLSTAWGMGQIMGYNFRICRCRSVEQMVEEAKESEANQLYQIVTYIIALNLTDELAALEWQAFAMGYHGPGYARLGVDRRLPVIHARIAGSMRKRRG